jgi:hypothetical protein
VCGYVLVCGSGDISLGRLNPILTTATVGVCLCVVHGTSPLGASTPSSRLRLSRRTLVCVHGASPLGRTTGPSSHLLERAEQNWVKLNVGNSRIEKENSLKLDESKLIGKQKKNNCKNNFKNNVKSNLSGRVKVAKGKVLLK